MSRSVAIIVAHPDDETLWAGGTILSHRSWRPFIMCLCRASDPDRAPRFKKTLAAYHAEGAMGDLDDGPDQKSLDDKDIQQLILQLLPPDKYFDLILSHDPAGEYTRHRRHEETSKAVINLWQSGQISANELWTFAYEDGNRQHYPMPVKNAPVFFKLSATTFRKKYKLVTETYGFSEDSWEAQATPRAEAFRSFSLPSAAKQYLTKREKNLL